MSAEIVEAFARLEKKIDKLIAQTAPKRPGDDEQVFKDPKEKYWQGESFAGCKLSECPAEYLRAYAKYKGACAFMGRKEGDPAKLQYAERDEKTAALARSWAEFREASGTEAKAPDTPKGKPVDKGGEDFGGPPDDDSIPF